MVAAEQTDQLAAHIDLVRPEDAGLIGAVGRLERDGIALLAQALERRFFALDKTVKRA